MGYFDTLPAGPLQTAGSTQPETPDFMKPPPSPSITGMAAQGLNVETKPLAADMGQEQRDRQQQIAGQRYQNTVQHQQDTQQWRQDQADRASAKAAAAAQTSHDTAVAKFGAANLPPVLPQASRAKLEAQATQKDAAMRANAAAALAASTQSHPQFNETEGGVFGMFGSPTAAAQTLQAKAQRLSDPSQVTDDDLNEYRQQAPDQFKDLDTTKKRLEDDDNARELHRTATANLARTQAIAHGATPEELDAVTAQRSPAGDSSAPDGAELAVHKAALERQGQDLQASAAQVQALQAKLQKGGSAQDMIDTQNQLRGLIDDHNQRYSAYQSGQADLAQRSAAISTRQQAQTERANAPTTSMPSPALPPIPPQVAMAHAVKNPDGSYTTSQTPNLDALTKGGAKAFWQDPANPAAPADADRSQAIEQTNGDMVGIRDQATGMAKSYQDIHSSIEQRLSTGDLTPEDATTEEQRAQTAYMAAHQQHISDLNQKLGNALSQFQAGKIDSQTLNDLFQTAGASKTGVQAFRDIQAQAEAAQAAQRAEMASKTSVGGAFGRAALSNAGEGVVGAGGAWAGAEAGAVLGTAIGTAVPVVGNVAGGIIGGLLGAIGGAVTGGYVGKKGQEALQGPEATAAREKQSAIDAAIHPIAAGMGGLLPTLPAMLVNPEFLVQKGAAKFVTPLMKFAAADAEPAAGAGWKLLNSAIQGGVFGGIESGGKLSTGEIGPGQVPWDILRSAVTMAPLGMIPGADATLRKFMGKSPGQVATIVGDVLGKAPADAATMAVSDALYDHFTGKKEFDASALSGTTLQNLPGFMALNLLGGLLHARAVGRVNTAMEGIDQHISAADAASKDHLAAFTDPTRHQEVADRLNQRTSELTGAMKGNDPNFAVDPKQGPITADEVRQSQEMTGPVAQSDSVRSADKAQDTLLQRSEQEKEAGNYDQAMASRQMALTHGRARNDFADQEALRGIGAMHEINRIRTEGQTGALADPTMTAMAGDSLHKADKFSALVKVARGQDALLTDGEQKALTDAATTTAPAVVPHEGTGQSIITDHARDELQKEAPLAATYVRQSETERRKQLNTLSQQQAEAATAAKAPASTTPAGGASRKAGGVPATSGTPDAQGVAKATPAEAAPAPPKESSNQIVGRLIRTKAATLEDIGKIKTGDPAHNAKLAKANPSIQEVLDALNQEKRVADWKAAHPEQAVPAEKPPETTGKGADPAKTAVSSPSKPETSPSDHGKGATFDADKWRENAPAELAKQTNIPEALRPHARAVLGMVHEGLKQYGKAFAGGVEFTRESQGGAGFGYKDGKVLINMREVLQDTKGNFRDGHTDAMREAIVERGIRHEYIHAEAVRLIPAGEATKGWELLGQTEEGRKLQKEVEDLYGGAHRLETAKDGKLGEAPTLPAFNGYHELVRAMIESSEFAGRVSETLGLNPEANSSLYQMLVKHLKAIAASILEHAQKLTGEARDKLLADHAKVAEAVRKFLGKEAPAETPSEPVKSEASSEPGTVEDQIAAVMADRSLTTEQGAAKIRAIVLAGHADDMEQAGLKHNVEHLRETADELQNQNTAGASPPVAETKTEPPTPEKAPEQQEAEIPAATITESKTSKPLDNARRITYLKSRLASFEQAEVEARSKVQQAEREFHTADTHYLYVRGLYDVRWPKPKDTDRSYSGPPEHSEEVRNLGWKAHEAEKALREAQKAYTNAGKDIVYHKSELEIAEAQQTETPIPTVPSIEAEKIDEPVESAPAEETAESPAEAAAEPANEAVEPAAEALPEPTEVTVREADAPPVGEAIPPPPEAKPAPLNMAGESRPARKPKAAIPEFSALHPKAQAKFNEAWEAKDVEAMKNLLDRTNKGLRGEFESRSGVKLPSTAKGMREAVDTHFAKPAEEAPAKAAEPEALRAARSPVTPDQDRLVEPGFYSKLDATIADKMPTKADPQTVKALVSKPESGIKAEELKWSGLLPWLDSQKGPVTKEQVHQYLADEGQVRFKEVAHQSAPTWTVKDSQSHETFKSQEEAEKERKRWITANMNDSEWENPDATGWVIEGDEEGGYRVEDARGRYIDDFTSEDRAQTFINEAIEERDNEESQKREEWEKEVQIINEGNAGDTGYSDYTLPGGENYREVVLTMPVPKKEMRVEVRASQKPWGTVYNLHDADTGEIVQNYDSPNKAFVEGKLPGFLKHRNNIVTDKAQKFTSSHFSDSGNYVAHMRVNDRSDAQGRPGTFIEEIQSDRHQQAREHGYKEDFGKQDMVAVDRGGYYEVSTKGGQFIVNIANEPQVKTEAEAIAFARQRIQDMPQRSGIAHTIPDAPFRSTWPLQMFKRALRDAVSADHKWIGWATGETQADRFSLAKQVSRVSYEPERGLLAAWDANGERVMSETTTPDKLPDHIGKEAARKLMDQPLTRKAHTLEGEDLKVGGEGMKGFYDQILPKEVAKYVKQWGGTVERAEMPTESPETALIWRMDIPPEMAKAIQEQGQPLFTPSSPSEDEPLDFTDPSWAATGEELDALKTIPSDPYSLPRYPDVDQEAANRTAKQRAKDLAEYTPEKEAEHIKYAAEFIAKHGLTKAEEQVYKAYGGEGPVYGGDVKLAQKVGQMLMTDALVSGDPAKMANATALNDLYNQQGRAAGRHVQAMKRVFDSPEEAHRWTLASMIANPPDSAAVRGAQTKEAKFNKIRSLEAEVKELREKFKDAGSLDRLAQGRKIKELEAQLAAAQKAPDQESAKAKEADERRGIIGKAWNAIGISLRDVFTPKKTVADAQRSPLVGKIMDELAKATDAKGRPIGPMGAKVMGMIFDNKSDKQISRATGIGPETVRDIEAKFDALAEPWFKKADDAGMTPDKYNLDPTGDPFGGLERKPDTLSASPTPLLKGHPNPPAAPSEWGTILKNPPVVRNAPSKMKEPFDISNPRHAILLFQHARRADATVGDMVYEYYMASIFSGPHTLFAKAGSDIYNFVHEYGVLRPIEAMMNNLFTRDFGDVDSATGKATQAGGATFGEYRSLAKSASRNFIEAFRHAWQSSSDGARLIESQRLGTGMLVDEQTNGMGFVRNQAIPGKLGDVVRFPGKGIDFVDAFARHLIGGFEVEAQAHRIARAEGLKPGTQAFDDRVTEQRNTPGSMAWVAAVHKGQELTSTEELPEMLKAGQKLMHSKNPNDKPGTVLAKWILKFMFPVVKTPYNFLRRGLVHGTPLGTLNMAGRLIKGWRGNQPMFESYPKAEIARHLAEQALAYGMTYMLMAAVEGDDNDDKKPLLITGSRIKAESAGQSQHMMRTRGGESSIVINGKPVFNYSRMEPIATALGTVVNMVREMKQTKHGVTVGQAVAHMVNDMMDQVRDKSFMQGLDGFMKLTDGGVENAGHAMVQNVLGAVVPKIISQPMKDADPIIRDRKSAPWYYNAFPMGGLAEPLYDLYGRQQVKGGSFASRLMNPSVVEPGAPMNADKALEKFNVQHPMHGEGPGFQYFPTAPGSSDTRYKDAAGKWQSMTSAEAAAFRQRAGKKMAEGVAGLPPVGTQENVDAIKKVRGTITTPTKKDLFPAGRSVVPVKRPPSFADLMGG